MTKYKMVQTMAAAFGMDTSRVLPNREPPPANAATKRPYDTTLDCSKLEQLGIGLHTPFSEGIQACLKNWN